MTTTLIVDDEVDMRMLVRVVIDLANSGLRVAGEAADGVEAVEAYNSLERPDPDVVIIDNRMPGLSGIEAARQILAKTPDQIVVLFSAHLDNHVREEAEAIGIAACLDKNRIDELPDLIRRLVGDSVS